MNKRRLVVGLVGLAFAGFSALLVATDWSDSKAGATYLVAPNPTPELLARGAYLAKLGDCAACHSVSGRPEYSGGLRMEIPIGAIYTSNITPDPKHGIGNFDLTDFDRALRFGVSRGHTLYPAMPFTSYANARPEDVVALYTYFKYGVPAAAVAPPDNTIVFPLSMRFPLTIWRWVFAPVPTPFVARPADDPAIARGAYFVEGLGHCGECHTPRGLAMQLQALTPADGDVYLSGAVIENYFAPSLRSAGAGSVSSWSVEDLAQFLSTGANDRGTAFGSMSNVIAHSTQYMTASDASDAARYLKSIRDPQSAAAVFHYDDATRLALRTGDASARGAQIYLDNCAACHRPDGKGYARVFPPLAGNPVVQASNPSSVVSIVLKGSVTPRTASTPAQFAMPAFAWRLTDQELADVVSFVRTGWGNDGKAVDVKSVQAMRKRNAH